jgi:hypothetical protein
VGSSQKKKKKKRKREVGEMCKSSKKKLKKHNLLDLVVLVLLLFCLVDCSEEREVGSFPCLFTLIGLLLFAVRKAYLIMNKVHF